MIFLMNDLEVFGLSIQKDRLSRNEIWETLEEQLWRAKVKSSVFGHERFKIVLDTLAEMLIKQLDVQRWRSEGNDLEIHICTQQQVGVILSPRSEGVQSRESRMEPLQVGEMRRNYQRRLKCVHVNSLILYNSSRKRCFCCCQLIREETEAQRG